MKGLLSIFTGLILTSLAVFADLPRGSVRVCNVTGEVTFAGEGRKEAQIPLVDGQILIEGTWIKTGPNSTVGLLFSNGSTAFLSANSCMSIKEFKQMAFDKKMGEYQSLKSDPSESKTVLDLKYGILVTDVKKLSPKSSYEIETPAGSAGVQGTQTLTDVQETENGYNVSFSSTGGALLVKSFQVGPNGGVQIVETLQNPGATTRLGVTLSQAGQVVGATSVIEPLGSGTQSQLVSVLEQNNLSSAASEASQQQPASVLTGTQSAQGGNNDVNTDTNTVTTNTASTAPQVDNTLTNQNELQAAAASQSQP